MEISLTFKSGLSFSISTKTKYFVNLFKNLLSIGVEVIFPPIRLPALFKLSKLLF
jgi:hypothetical protein